MKTWWYLAREANEQALENHLKGGVKQFRM